MLYCAVPVLHGIGVPFLSGAFHKSHPGPSLLLLTLHVPMAGAWSCNKSTPLPQSLIHIHSNSHLSWCIQASELVTFHFSLVLSSLCFPKHTICVQVSVGQLKNHTLYFCHVLDFSTFMMPGQIYFKITLLSQLQLSHIIMSTKVT